MKRHSRCRCRQVIIVPYFPRRRRKRRKQRVGTGAEIHQGASVNGAMSGLINIVIQVPINAGDATSLNESDNNAVTNLL